MPSPSTTLLRFAGLAAAAQRPVVLTGAGVSAESGIPTFRGPGGLWRNHRPEDLATPEAFRRNPEMVWEWYQWRRALVAAAAPNPAHLWLARWQRERSSLVLITQNVDGLHRSAGSTDPIEIHGSLWRVRCIRCGAEAEDRRVPLPTPPLCEDCAGLLRPGVVWFGETLPEAALDQATAAVRRADLLLVLGTSAVVHPVAALPALAGHATVVEINPQETTLTPQVDWSIRSPAGEFLAPLLKSDR